MKDKEKGDIIGSSHCSNCSEETVRQYFGFVPHHMMDIGPLMSWYEAQICVSCGSLTPLNVVEEDVEEVEEEYVNTLVDLEIIDEDEKENWLTKEE